MIEAPPSFIVRTEAEKAAFDNGFRIADGENGGWIAFRSATAWGTLWIAATGPQGPWFVAISHPGVAAEIGLPPMHLPGAPGLLTISVAGKTELHAVVARAYQLGSSLPDAPLQAFERAITGLPRTTEAEHLVVQRIGQDKFRDALMTYWGGRCPLTGITDPALLRASHIVRWADCETDALRLDVHNGLLLSSLWDAAFDGALLSFSDDGVVMPTPGLSDAAADALGLEAVQPLAGLTDKHRANLKRHRVRAGLA